MEFDSRVHKYSPTHLAPLSPVSRSTVVLGPKTKKPPWTSVLAGFGMIAGGAPVFSPRIAGTPAIR
jgi:hypothetical protein